MRAVGEPIEQSCSEMFLAHHAIPITKCEIGGNDEGTTFIERRTKLEEEIGSITGEGNEAKLIQDEQLVLAEHSQKARQFQVVLGTDQVIDQGRHIVEAHAATLSAGGQSQSCGDVRLAQSRISNHENRLSLA